MHSEVTKWCCRGQIRSDLSRHPAVLAAVQETGTPLRQAMQQWHPDNTDAVSRAMSDTVTSEMFVVLGLRVSLDTFSWPDPCLESLSRELTAATVCLHRTGRPG